MPAGIAAGHPATAEAGLSVLAAGGSAADAAVAAVLASCVAETVLTGLAGGGYATYYDASTGTVSCLDFFVAIPGLDGGRPAAPMIPLNITMGRVPIPYEIGAASVAVPGVPAGCGALHSRWGRLPWATIVAPAVELARRGVPIPAQQARTLRSLSPALMPGDGAAAYAPGGRLLQGGGLLKHAGLDRVLETLADEGPEVFYTGGLGRATVAAVQGGGGIMSPTDLASYRVLELPSGHAEFADGHVYGRTNDLNQVIETLADLGGSVLDTDRAGRAVLLAGALRDHAPQRLGETTNISVVDPDDNACVVTTTLGLGAGVWLPGLGVHLNSMLGEGELIVGSPPPGDRLGSMMCPLVVTATPVRPAHTPSGRPRTVAVGGVPPGRPGPGLPDDAKVAVHTAGVPGHPAGQRDSVAELGELTGSVPLPPTAAEPRRPPHRDNLQLAVGAAGASRIRTALVHTMTGVLVDGLDPETAIARARFHVVDGTAHAEPGVPEDELAALSQAGYRVHQWPDFDHYFGGVSAVGRTGAGGDPRRGGIGMHL